MRRTIILGGLALGLLSSASLGQSYGDDPLGPRIGRDLGTDTDPRLRDPGPLEQDRRDDPGDGLGRQRFDAYTDRHGITSGRVDGQRFEGRTDRYGTGSGRAGGRSFDCVTDRLGFSTCR
jgi:hypothetical protein